MTFSTHKTLPILLALLLLIPFSKAHATGVERIHGQDRYETAVKVSAHAYEKANYAILASGTSFPDALSAAPLSQGLKAPMLLSPSDALPKVVKEELTRLGTKTVYLIGGQEVMPNKLIQELAEMKITTIRVSGRDRYNTSEQIARLVRSQTPVNQGFLTSGTTFPDALSISSYAAWQGIPVLLTDGQSLTETIVDSLKGMSKVTIVGGEAIISNRLETALEVLGKDSVRVAGAYRYITSAAIAETYFKSPKTVYIVNGTNFPDALGAAPAAGKANAPVLLTNGIALDKSISDYLTKAKPKNIVLIGGEEAISKALETSLKSFITP